MLTITCLKRDCYLTLWNDLQKLDEVQVDDVARNLVISMDEIYRRNHAKITNIAFLAGPASFTSARIISAVCSGIQLAKPDTYVIPVSLDEAIYSFPEYINQPIKLQCNTSLYHVYTDRWTLTQAPDSCEYISPDQVDMPLGLAKFAQNCHEKREIIPFYGHSIM